MLKSRASVLCEAQHAGHAGNEMQQSSTYNNVACITLLCPCFDTHKQVCQPVQATAQHQIWLKAIWYQLLLPPHAPYPRLLSAPLQSLVAPPSAL
jgi:hypothetical protein